MDTKNTVLTVLVLIFSLKSTHQRALDPMQHLYKYGYLNSTEASNDTMKAAVKKYQAYHGLLATGSLDEGTTKKMSQPRCGMPDIPTLQPSCSNLVQTLPRWPKNHVTYKIQNWTAPFNNTILESLFDRSIQLWTENVSLQISTSGANKSDIDVYFKYVDGLEDKLAYACKPADGNIYFDSSENWSLENYDDYEDETVETGLYIGWAIAHELGHSLGLEHVNTVESIMYPMYNTIQIEPSMLDREMLRHLYRGASDFDNKIFCDKSSVDAMMYTSYDNYILIKGNRFWDFDEESLEAGPFPLDIFFPGLPAHIDAAFSVKNTNYFFSGNVFYRYIRNEKKYRKKLISIGFENVMPSNIDAAFFDLDNNTIYFFKGAKYYGFNIRNPIGQRLVVDGKKISDHWPGIPNNIEAAIYTKNNKVLFIKNSKCYIADSVSRKVLRNQDCASTFFRCPTGTTTVLDKVKRDVANQQPQRRCGRPDNVVAVRTAPRWEKKHLTYKIRNWTEPLNETEVKTVFEDAIRLWTTNVSLHVSEAKRDNADIDVYFKNLDGEGNLIGYAHFPESGSIYFDSSDKWSLVKTATDDSIFAGWLVAHELGHSLGLDHAESIQSIMYPVYNTEQTEPSMMDNQKLREVYGEGPPLNNSILCPNASVDAMLYTSTKDHILIKGKQYWYFFDETIDSGPHSLDDLFPGLPDNIDAAFSVKKLNYFLKDDVYYRFKTNENEYRKKLISTGLRNMPGQVDAAFFEPNSETINFFKGAKYYVFDMHGRNVVVNGTNISEAWSQVPSDIEAAAYFENDKVLFLKDSICYTVEYSSKKLLHKEDCTSNFFRCSKES